MAYSAAQVQRAKDLAFAGARADLNNSVMGHMISDASLRALTDPIVGHVLQALETPDPVVDPNQSLAPE
jgi:hypothetical protein